MVPKVSFYISFNFRNKCDQCQKYILLKIINCRLITWRVRKWQRSLPFLQFFDLLNYNTQFGVRKFIISRFKTNFFSLFSYFVESNHQNYKSVGLSNDDIRVSWPIRHMFKRVIILYVICIIFVWLYTDFFSEETIKRMNNFLL